MTTMSDESAWRLFLTPEEKRMFKRIENAKAKWRELNAHRNEILNRANQRARHHATRQAMTPRERRRQRVLSEHTKGEG